MSIQYYTGFFEAALPEQMVALLRNDIAEPRSLVVIAGFGNWLPNEDSKVDINFAKDTWFDPAGIVFDEYHLIDAHMPKEKAHALLRSVLLFCFKAAIQRCKIAF
jgi:cyanophycinase